MSENLKRAESLFNRIMNPNKPQGPSENGSKNYHKSSSNHNNHYQSNGNDSDLSRSTSRYSNNHSNGNSNGNHHRYNTRSYNKYNHNNLAQPAAGANFDLPKRDPAKEAQDAVLALAPNLHVLPYCWTIWHHSRTKTKVPTTAIEEAATPSSNSVNGANGAEPVKAGGAAAVDSYLQAATEIGFPCFGTPDKTVKPIASLEQMWVSLSSLKKSHELANGSELLIFKTGVNPVWEDPINAKGGRWVFRFSHRVNPNASTQETQESVQRGRRRATLVWERLVLKALTGSLLLGRKEHHDALLSDIVGLVLSVRRDEEIISMWNSNLHFAKKRPDEEEKKGTLTGFHARRVYCDAILRVIREVDAIMQGSDCIETQLSSSNERVSGVTFEYRLHSDNSHPYNNDRPRRGKNYHHHNHQREEKEDEA